MAQVAGLWDRPDVGVDDRWAPLRGVGVEASQASQAMQEVGRWSEDQIDGGLAELDDAQGALERCLMVVVLEAHRRGLHLDTGLSLHDWVASRCPRLPRAVIADLVVLARGWDISGHEVVCDAVARGEVSAARAAKLVRALNRVRHVTDAETYVEAAAILLPVAIGGSDKDLRAATDHLIAVALPERESEAAARACRELRGVNESSLADGSLTRFVITADQEGAAAIRAILRSPLAAPASANGVRQRQRGGQGSHRCR